MKTSELLEYLARDDKWYLGGGKALVWAPEFPKFLDRPGFWDQAYYLDHAICPMFTFSILDEDHEELHMACSGRVWRPDCLTQRYMVDGSIEITETKCVTPFDALTGTLTIENKGREERELDVIVWTAQPIASFSGHPFYNAVTVSNPSLADDGVIVFDHTDLNPKDMRLQKAVAFGADRSPSSYCVVGSQHTGNLPVWRLTPFYEKMQHGAMPNSVSTSGVAMDLLGIPDRTLVYMGLHFRIALGAGQSESLTGGMSVAPDRAGAEEALLRSVRGPEPAFELARAEWEDFFSKVPMFECSDPYIQKYYWYRWYGIRLNLINVGAFNLMHPCVGEGPNPYYFRRNISYSAQCHLMECRWMNTPEVAQGSVLNFCDNQNDNGLLPASIGATENLDYLIYHANWGMAVEELNRVHPDTAFLEAVYEPLKRYSAFLDRERDCDGAGLCDVANQFETGQEYTSRYVFADERADEYSWYDLSKNIRLKGVDASVYAYDLKRVLSRIAALLGHEDDARAFEREAGKAREAVLEKMWDPDIGFFVDVDRTGEKRSWVKAAVGFYPFMTDIASEKHLDIFYKHLFNPSEFWTEYPVPAVSADDPYFNDESEWKSKRHICPWNGRVWPMTNSHVCEALARASIHFDPELKPRAAELIRRFIRMMFANDDLARPNCFEHYSPTTGKASFYRGVDDYQHSWVVDLIVKYVVGLLPVDEPRIIVDPLPFGMRSFSMSGVPYKGHELAISWDEDDGMRLTVDGLPAGRRPTLGRLEFELPSSKA